MISMAVYSQDEELIKDIKIILNAFIKENKLMSNLHACKDYFTLMIDSACDIYILDLDYIDDIEKLIVDLKSLRSDATYVLIGSETKEAHLISDLKIDYFLLKPLSDVKLLDILNTIKINLKDSYILIPVTKGIKKIKVKDINYIDLEGRCLHYHFDDGTDIEGPCIQCSFEKATSFLLLKKARSLIFIKPSLILNLNRINSIIDDFIIFDNGEKYYLKHCAKDSVINSWKNFTRFINLPEFYNGDEL